MFRTIRPFVSPLRVLAVTYVDMLNVTFGLKFLTSKSFKAVQFPAIYAVLIYRVSQKECARLREGVPYVKVYRYNPKHLCPKLNGYGDNGQRSLKL